MGHNIKNQSDEMWRGVLDTGAAPMTHLFVEKAKRGLSLKSTGIYTRAGGSQVVGAACLVSKRGLMKSMY